MSKPLPVSRYDKGCTRGSMIKLNLLRPKAVFSYDGHAIVRHQYDFWKSLVSDDSPPYDWKPGTLNIKYISAPPKPPDWDELDWKLLHDMIDAGGIINDGDFYDDDNL